ncbi:MAG: single-stranded DNA-binding protein [Anaerolineaceae bacterium]|nr:single-stranded DNA-binding protein [Anaerolineaceae bacterium]
MYHTIVFVGNLGRDPEMRYTPSGKAVTSFSVAVSDGFGDRKKTIWFRVSAWEKQAESCNNYLQKGSKVLVEGRLQSSDSGNPRIWTRQDGTPGASYEITASIVRFLSAKGEVEANVENAPASNDMNDEEIPF